MRANEDLKQVLRKADDLLLTDPKATLNIIETIQPQINPQKQPHAYVWAHLLAARSASLLGESDRILSWAEPAQVIAEQLGDATLLVKIQAVLGEGHEFAGDSAQAKNFYKKAVQIAEQSKNDWLIAYALNFLGWMHNRKMEEKQAMETIQRAYKLMKQLPPDDLYYDLLNNLGTLYGNKVLGRELESLTLLNEAKQYFISKGKHFYASVILYNLGIALKNQPKAALEAFQEALASSEKIDDESSIAYCHYGLGLAYSTLKNFAATEQEYQLADRGFIKSNNIMMAAELQKQLIITYTVSGQFEKALRALPRADEMLRKYGSRTDMLVFLEQKILVMNALARKDDELATYREFSRLSHEHQLQQDRETINKFTVEFDLERKEHEKEVLAAQNRLQSLELEKADRTRNILLGAALLCACIMVLVIRSKLKDREMRSQQRRMQQILDSIQEGILRFGADLRLEKDFSAHLLHLLRRQDDLSGQTIFEVLLEPSPLSLDEKSQIREALGLMLGEPRISWELNSGHLPAELVIHEQVLSLNWEPLFDGQDRLQKIQLILRNITESRQLEQTVAAERARLDIWQVRLQQLLSHDFKRALVFLRESVQKLDLQMPRADLLRSLHTIKGNARTLGLKSLADVSHRLESAFAGHDSELLSLEQEAWEREIQEWAPLIHTMGFAAVTAPQQIYDILLEIIPGLQQMLIAERLHLAELLIQDQVQVWPRSSLETFRTILLHGLTNALDHGYILPSRRGETMSHVKLGIEISRTADCLQLIIRDAGRGLDWEKIRLIAEAKKFQAAPGRLLSDVLFQDGTTTTREISTTSGRGIGLSVVASTCAALRGEVALLDNDRGPGTQLVVKWPVADAAA